MCRHGGLGDNYHSCNVDRALTHRVGRLDCLQFIDIAIASGYAAICLSIMLAVSPVAPHEAAGDAAAQHRLDAAISMFVGRVGLPFLTTAPFSAICSATAQATNSSLAISASVDGVACDNHAGPTAELAHSSFSLDLPGRSVVISGWLAER